MTRYITILFLILIVFYSGTALGQATTERRPKGHLYISWGYNKDWYSGSDLHFKSKSNDDFDFTVYNAKAHDRPNFNRIFNSSISIPQFIYRVGYSFARHPNMGIEIGFDHAKYIMTRNTVLHVKGKIHENYIDKDTLVSPDFLRFEHTNGANFLMISYFQRRRILYNTSEKSELYAVLKPGAGIVIPQSEVALFGTDQNNNYHIAGYVFGLDLDLRYEFKKHLVIETGFKGVFANYLDVLSVADSKANHHFFCLEWLVSIGYQLAI